MVASPVQPDTLASHYQAYDALATLVAVVNAQGVVLFCNTALEDVLAVSRRSIVGTQLAKSFADSVAFERALAGANSFAYAALRYDAGLLRVGHEPLPVHVIMSCNEVSTAHSVSGLDGVNDADGANHADDASSVIETIVEMVVQERQTRQDREERLAEQARTHKELIRNLAHEIKNPLGGIRGAAQLLEMDLPSPELREYTQVIIHEADRLQLLVDRLLEPHRLAHVVGEVNIHDVCERVRSLILAQYPKGLALVRDYDVSIPEFRGDREHLIQAVLNLAHNAAQALGARIEAGDACITLRTRVLRQITFGKQRYRLALELHVLDNGPGIAEAIKDRIFYPLVSGREGGTGLGLTLAQTFIQQHQGQIEVQSEPGCTDFTVLIPLA